MRPVFKIKNGYIHCRWCIKRNGYPRTFKSIASMYRHLSDEHSDNKKYKFKIDPEPTTNGYYRFSVSGTCACGCGETVSYSGDYAPEHPPPYYKSGHLSKTHKYTAGRFEKGQVSWNKDTKGVMKANSGSFKKGNVPQTDRGGNWTDPRGQKYVWTGKRRKEGTRIYKAVSRIVMEEKLGRKLKKSEIVIHLDEIVSNDDPENLEVITRALNATRNRWRGRKTMTKKQRQAEMEKRKADKQLKREMERLGKIKEKERIRNNKQLEREIKKKQLKKKREEERELLRLFKQQEKEHIKMEKQKQKIRLRMKKEREKERLRSERVKENQKKKDYCRIDKQQEKERLLVDQEHKQYEKERKKIKELKGNWAPFCPRCRKMNKPGETCNC